MSESTVKVTKSATNRVMFGVCGGLGEYFNLDPNIVRLIFIVSTLFGGLGLIAYLAGAILMPEPGEITGSTEDKPVKSSGNAILIIGSILIIIGIYYILREADFFFLPHWLDTWIWRITHFFNFWGIVLIIFGLLLIFKHHGKTEAKEGRLVKLKSDRKIGGVCSGLGKYLGIDGTIIRIVFVLFALFASFKIAIISYLILLILMPEEE